MIPIPQNDHKIRDSDINLKPIASHQKIKNGFNPVRRIPAKNGPCFGCIKWSTSC
jgi:hypothetical protein